MSRTSTASSEALCTATSQVGAAQKIPPPARVAAGAALADPTMRATAAAAPSRCVVVRMVSPLITGAVTVGPRPPEQTRGAGVRLPAGPGPHDASLIEERGASVCSPLIEELT